MSRVPVLTFKEIKMYKTIFVADVDRNGILTESELCASHIHTYICVIALRTKYRNSTDAVDSVLKMVIVQEQKQTKKASRTLTR